MEHPLDYLAELKVFTDEERKQILLDNVSELNQRRPA
jgi:hypothetical protein